MIGCIIGKGKGNFNINGYTSRDIINKAGLCCLLTFNRFVHFPLAGCVLWRGGGILEDMTPSSEQVARPWFSIPTTGSRVIFLLLVSIPIMVLYGYWQLPRSASIDSASIDVSETHVAELIKRWQKERRQRIDDVISQQTTGVAGERQRLPREQNVMTSEERESFGAGRRSKRIHSNPKRKHEEERTRYAQILERTIETQNLTVTKPVIKMYHINDNIPDIYECLWLKVIPKTPICIYDPQTDVYVSKEIKINHIWEGHIVSQIQSILRAHPGIGLIDVGANIGQYTLIAANMGHRVLAVEPWIENLRRFNKAINIAGLSDKIRILQNAVSNRRTSRCLVMNANNQGDIRVSRYNSTGPSRKNCSLTHTILLDDLVEHIPFTEALLKVDIQGYEQLAFLHVDKLLDKIYIPYIFIEWVLMREIWISRFHSSLDKAMVSRMVALLIRREYRAFSAGSGRELDSKYWHGWPEDVVWKHASVLQI